MLLLTELVIFWLMNYKDAAPTALKFAAGIMFKKHFMAQQIGSLIWVLLCIFVGFRQISIGLPDVRDRIRAGKGTAEDLARLKKHKMLGWIFIVIGIGSGLPDLMRFLFP
jgi:hypothetical protein